MVEKRFCEINNKKPVDNGNNIKTKEKGKYKFQVLFPVKEMTDQDEINKIGSGNLENPMTKIVDDHLFKSSFIIFSVHSYGSKQK